MNESTYRDNCLAQHRMFDYLYVQGYTAALLDVLKVLDYIQPDLKRHRRRQSAKTYHGIVQCMLDNRVALREDPDAFIRCASDGTHEYELWNARWSRGRTKSSQK